MAETDPIAIADEIVYGVDWDHTPDNEFPKFDSNKLHEAITQAIHDAYERAAKEAENTEWDGTEIRERENGDEYYAEQGHELACRRIAAAIRALKGDQ